MEIATILAVIGAGVTYSLSAYGKKEGQPFDFGKFGATVLVGAVAGLGVAAANLPLSVGYDYLIGLGVVPVAENAMKILYRKVLPKFGLGRANAKKG